MTSLKSKLRPLLCCCGSPKRELTLAIFGVDGAGKTVTIQALKGGKLDPVAPTVGFRNEDILFSGHVIKLYDLGGSRNFRGVWQHYVHEIHAMIYVIDSADVTRLDETKETFTNIIANERFVGKPILILANKQDLPNALNINDMNDLDVMKEFATKLKSPCSLEPCSAIKGTGRRMDKRLKAGLHWLYRTIMVDYDSINERREQDIEEVKAERAREKREMRARVMAVKEEREKAEAEERKKLGQELACEDNEDNLDELDGLSPFKPLNMQQILKMEKAEKSRSEKGIGKMAFTHEIDKENIDDAELDETKETTSQQKETTSKHKETKNKHKETTNKHKETTNKHKEITHKEKEITSKHSEAVENINSSNVRVIKVHCNDNLNMSDSEYSDDADIIIPKPSTVKKNFTPVETSHPTKMDVSHNVGASLDGIQNDAFCNDGLGDSGKMGKLPLKKLEQIVVSGNLSIDEDLSHDNEDKKYFTRNGHRDGSLLDKMDRIPQGDDGTNHFRKILFNKDKINESFDSSEDVSPRSRKRKKKLTPRPRVGDVQTSEINGDVSIGTLSKIHLSSGTSDVNTSVLSQTLSRSENEMSGEESPPSSRRAHRYLKPITLESAKEGVVSKRKKKKKKNRIRRNQLEPSDDDLPDLGQALARPLPPLPWQLNDTLKFPKEDKDSGNESVHHNWAFADDLAPAVKHTLPTYGQRPNFGGGDDVIT